MEEKRLTIGNTALAAQPRVITIEATKQPQSRKLRVAAYCRVSSDSADQLNSFVAQANYYTALIASTPNWQMADLYADEGITGTSADKRGDFQRLLADCRRGLIDRVLVKSISRFARNTKECLEAIRELKALGISILFEEQNLDTAQMSGEMVAAVHAAFAQIESENISKNMRWSYQKRMQMGVFVPPKQPYGYELAEGIIHVNITEAEHIRFIFTQYLAGWNTQQIADYLNQLADTRKEAVASPKLWTYLRIAKILRNEKYAGNSLWQKFYNTEALPHKERVNRGEREQYFAEDTHPAIIDKKTFQRVQELLKKRGQSHVSASVSLGTPFRERLVCGCCGSLLRARTINGIAYRACRTHDVKPDQCPLKPIRECALEQAFLRLHYNLKRHPILSQYLTDLHTIRERQLLWREDVVAFNKEISELSSQVQMLAQIREQGLIDPDIFIAQSNELARQLRDTKLRKERFLDTLADQTVAQTKAMQEALESSPSLLDTFDPELFGELVDRIIVEDNERIRFRLKNGLELPETIERTVR